MLRFIGAALLLFPILIIISEIKKRGHIRAATLLKVADFSKFYLEEMEKYKSSPGKIIEKYRTDYALPEIINVAEAGGINYKHPWACILLEEEKRAIADFFSKMGSSSYDTEKERARNFLEEFCAKASLAEEQSIKNGKIYPLLFAAFAAGVLILIL